ncbi:hypothetical protein BDQ17DRAFT_1341889, partial [Cyathus striatus]
MSVINETIIPREPRFPMLLPQPPKPHPIPLPKRRVYGHINAMRDLQREMDDLSDEENELEDLTLLIHNRGYSFLVPIGRNLTQQEEKNDASDSEDEDSQGSGGAPSVVEDEGENDSTQDLDASMEDLDEDRTVDTEDNEEFNDEGNTEDYEEESSDM